MRLNLTLPLVGIKQLDITVCVLNKQVSGCNGFLEIGFVIRKHKENPIRTLHVTVTDTILKI